MKTQKHNTHLNSNIENVGSDSAQSEVTKFSGDSSSSTTDGIFKVEWLRCAKTNPSRYQFRKEYRISQILFVDIIDAVVQNLAEATNQSVEQIEQRYQHFVNHLYGNRRRLNNFPFIRSVWNEFVAYENGGEPLNPSKSFKEPLYRKAK